MATGSCSVLSVTLDWKSEWPTTKVIGSVSRRLGEKHDKVCVRIPLTRNHQPRHPKDGGEE
jgi:hypothetical protein